MTEENIEKIREGMRQLDEATNGIQGLSVFALAMPHGTRGQMQVQILSKGSDTQVAHKLYECMRHDASLSWTTEAETDENTVSDDDNTQTGAGGGAGGNTPGGELEG